MHQRLEEELQLGGGIVTRRALPGFGPQIDRALRDGELVRVLQGIYARPLDAETMHIRTRAVAAADSLAVICGRAAASLHGWHTDAVPIVDAASSGLRPNQWLRIERRHIPATLIRRFGMRRATSRALTAVDLIPELGPGIIDEALRRRVGLDEMRAALAATPKRPGNRQRAAALRGSRDQPWSAAERVGHQALRDAGVRGWRANHPIITDPDEPPIAVIDIAFRRLKLAIEIDGAEYHLNERAFHRDRLRDERLALLGWQVIRFSARRVLEDPEGFASTVAHLARIRQRQIPLS